MPGENVNFIAKITHINSGKEIGNGYLAWCAYVEQIDLGGPKLIIEFIDLGDYIRNELGLQEYDELEVTFKEQWRQDGVTIKEKFTILTVMPVSSYNIKLNCLSSVVYNMKKPADKTRIFSHRGLGEIMQAVGGKMSSDVGKFAIVENYHVIAGERPTTMLRQMAEEQGMHCWYAREKFHIKSFAELYSRAETFTFHHNKIETGYPIFSYRQPSQQLNKQEENIRRFTGWNEDEGRMKTGNIKLLSGNSHIVPKITGNPHTYTLNKGPVTSITVIDFITFGNLTIEAGQVQKLVWHLDTPENPINEKLPDKIVVESVSHWFRENKYYCRIKGAKQLESF